MAACKRALAMKGAASVADSARKLMAKINKAKASALTRGQAKIVAKIFKAILNIQSISLTQHYEKRYLMRHLAATKSCVAATKAALAAGVSLIGYSDRIRVGVRVTPHRWAVGDIPQVRAAHHF